MRSSRPWSRVWAESWWTSTGTPRTSDGVNPDLASGWVGVSIGSGFVCGVRVVEVLEGRGRAVRVAGVFGDLSASSGCAVGGVRGRLVPARGSSGFCGQVVGERGG